VAVEVHNGRPDVWERPRSADAVRVVLEVAEAAGLPRSVCLSGTGLDPGDLLEPDQVVVADQELAAIRNLVTSTDDRPGLGTQAARGVRLGTLGVWGLAMMSSRTVRELVAVALRQGLRKFSWGLLDVRIVERDTGVQAIFDETSVPEDVRNFVIERDLAFSVAVLDLLLGVHPDVMVMTTLPADRVAALREAVGPQRLVPGGGRNVITFRSRMLDEELPGGDALAAAMCEQQCEQLLERVVLRAPDGSFRAKVEAVLQRLPASSWSLDKVAAARFVHPRTVDRLLAAEGTSFRELVAAARERSATALLTETDQTVSQIARRLGYAHTQSFARAYKSWTGVTPGAVRRRSALTQR
jgi:AraC-like DNA-binding protein